MTSISENSFFLVCLITIASLKSTSYCLPDKSFTADEMRPLPSDTDSWERIRATKSLYVDKTRYLKHLTERPLQLVARPRQFGKSTFVDMAKHFYMATNGSLFEGLYVHEIGNTEWMRLRFSHRFPKLKQSKWLEFPVIDINFALLHAGRVEIMEDLLHERFKEIAKSYGVDFDIGNIFTLIDKLSFEKQLPVVILIDDYDASYQKLLSNKHNDSQMANDLVSFYNSFYECIENTVDYIGLAFVTGLSSLEFDYYMGGGTYCFPDFTYGNKMAAVFGFTEEEIETDLRYHVQELAKVRAPSFGKQAGITCDWSDEEVIKDLFEWYGGYQFDYQCKSPRVSNPVSVIKSLSNKKITVFRAKLEFMDAMIENFYQYSKSLKEYENGVVISEKSLEERVAPGVRIIPWSNKICLTNGYFTIDDYNGEIVRLKSTNKEVEMALEDALANYDFHRKGYLVNTRQHELINLNRYLHGGQIEDAMATLKTFNLRSYNYSEARDDDEFITDEVPKRLEIIFNHSGIEVKTKQNIFRHTTLTNPSGLIDIIVLNLPRHLAIIKVECAKNTTSVKAIKKLLHGIKNDPIAFMDALDNPKLCYFIGLHFKLNRNADIVLKDWIHFPFYKGKINFQEIHCSHRKIKEQFKLEVLPVDRCSHVVALQ